MKVYVSKTIRILFVCMMLWVVGLCLFATDTEYVCKVVFSYSSIIYAIAGCLAFAIVGLVAFYVAKLLDKSKYVNLIMVGFSILYCIGLIFLTRHYYFETGWDANVVEMNANNIVLKEWGAMSNFYYSYCPNNIFLTYLVLTEVKKCFAAVRIYEELIWGKV